VSQVNPEIENLQLKLARNEGTVDAIARLQNEVELMLEEEPKGAAREALQNVMTLLESESIEYDKRRKALVYELREAGFSVEF
jgi:hypothetical protein